MKLNIKTKEELDETKRLQDIKERIAALQQKLKDTDYKVMPDYDRTNDTILEERQAWREEIRTLSSQLV